MKNITHCYQVSIELTSKALNLDIFILLANKVLLNLMRVYRKVQEKNVGYTSTAYNPNICLEACICLQLQPLSI